MNSMLNYYLAPVQGHTDAAYRQLHRQFYNVCGNNGVETQVHYTTPFIRLEKGEIRKKDLKDFKEKLTEFTAGVGQNAAENFASGIDAVPQVIFKNGEELEALVSILRRECPELTRIDINMGCPFPLQTARGRGAATIASGECREAVKRVVQSNPEISFSVKMRLGMEDENEWKPLLNTLNTLALDHIAVHPRTAKDQYRPDTLHPEIFAKILAESANPVIYNGDILTLEDAQGVLERWPQVSGLMVGRGVLGRPSLLAEIAEGKEWDTKTRLARMMEFHDALFNHYSRTLVGGEHQVLSKILPFWEYAEEEIGRKAWKVIKKASSMAKYRTALALIGKI